MRVTDSRVTSTVALVATSVWLGGILVLGAIVAPIVFTMVPRPEAAEAMVIVFQRFDLVAVGCVAIVVATEALRALGGARGSAQMAGRATIGRLDVARMLMAVVGAALVLVEAMWITPSIASLHRHGAIRGLGADGLELDRMHGLAETSGKLQVVFALAIIALHVATVAGGALGGAAAETHDKEAGGGAIHGA
jgi:uncharacterized membrane protein